MKPAILALIVLLISLFVYISPINAQNLSPILFWGEGCPHCERVKEEIKRGEIDQKILIDYREIYYSEDNANLFDQKIKECGISPYNAGVPLMYINGSCWVGTDEIIYALEKEIEENVATYIIDNSNNEQLDTDKQFEGEMVNEQSSETNQIFTLIFILAFFIVLIIGISVYFVWSKKRK